MSFQYLGTMLNTDAEPASNRRAVFGLSCLFAAMYFVQGISEPTEGLIAQPVKSFQKGSGYSAGEIAAFTALLATPWMIKPVYGLLTDFLPIFGTRRRSYLLLATTATAMALFFLFLTFTPSISRTALFLALLVPSIGIAMTDVVVDAVMVERGQKYGMTGRFQSVQWAALYAAPVVAGPVAGYLAQHQMQRVGFLICGLAAAVSLVLTMLFVREQRQVESGHRFRDALATLREAISTPGLAAVAGFLFLWNFNPFANDVLYLHFTVGLGLAETFYGWTVSAMGLSAVVASIAYGFYCRRVPFGVLLHASIVLGVISTLGYVAVVGERSAIAVTLVVGFTYMTAVLIQLDLAARACPPKVAGTAFALLMSVTNFSLSSAIAVGGQFYDWGQGQYGAVRSFQLLVLMGSVCSLASWLFVPFLTRRLGTDTKWNSTEDLAIRSESP